jgi:hypothetical protein
MIAKVTQRTELGPLVALPTARHARVERGNRLSPTQHAQLCMDCHVEACHAAIRSSSHSSMKAENWFQLRIVGVTTADTSSEIAPIREKPRALT